MSKTSSGLLKYAAGQLGRPYWYGTYGQISTRALYKQKKAQYPANYDKWPEQSFLDQLNVKVHDCVGLIKGYVMGSGDPDIATPYNSKYDVSANGLFNLCSATGSINTLPEIPGLIVWKSNHVGVYIGGGYVIEARGHAYGVVKTKVEDRPWTHWGKLPSSWITYDNKEETCVANLIVLKRGIKGIDSIGSWQMLLRGYNYNGLDNELIRVDEDFGANTEYATKQVQRVHRLTQTGIVDGPTWEALIK